MPKAKLKFICTTACLRKVDYLVRHIEYRKNRYTAILFYYQQKPYAYLNHCMHMKRRLDCQRDTIFDKEGKLLTCSMHGFVFEPSTGECLSPVCAGQKLQSLKIVVEDDDIYFSDRHVQMMD